MTTFTATGTATDNLSASATDDLVVTVGTAGALDKIVKYLHRSRPNFNSLVDVPRFGPVYTDEPAEVGNKFYVEIACTMTGMRMFKAPAASGTIPVTVWNYTTHEALATLTFTWVVDDGGWFEIDFDTPIPLLAGVEYCISYYANVYPETHWRFNAQEYYEWPFHVVAGALDNGDGTFRSASCTSVGIHQFPFYGANQASWFWIDPRIEYDSTVKTYDGGRAYLDQWPNGSFNPFPISVFSVDAGFFADYQAIGINMPLPTDTVDVRDELVALGTTFIGNGKLDTVRAIVSDPALSDLCKMYYYWDEPDLLGTGGTVTEVRNAFAALRRLDSTRPAYFGFGFAMLRGQSFAWFPSGAGAEITTPMWRSQALMTDMTTGNDYAMSDGRGVWVYGIQMDRLRDVNDDKTPTWATIETCIQPGGIHQPTVTEMKAAAMLAIIHGAKGIMWFDHQFPASTPDGTNYPLDFQVILNDSAKASGLTAFHAFLQTIADALWAGESSLDRTIASSNRTAGPVGGELGVPIHASIREAGSFVYMLAQAARPGTTTGTFTVLAATGQTITVLGESRTISADGSGTWTDTFTSDYAYHVYRWSATAAPIVSTPSLNPLQQAVAFSQTLTAIGATPITWARTAGTLPAGLTLSSAGVLSGTPTGSGSYDFTVTATNSSGTGTKHYTGTITAAPTPPTITTTTLGTVEQTRPLSVTIAYTGDPATSVSVTAGSLPAGLGVAVSSGVITVSGTPTTLGAFSFTLTAANAGGSDSQAYSGTVVAMTVHEYNVFGTAAPPFTYTSHSDGGFDSWLGNQFYLSSSPSRAFQVVGVRIYVPAGSGAIGGTGAIGIVRRALGAGGVVLNGAGGVAENPHNNGTETAMSGVLVAGWNDFYLTTPVPANSGDSLVACVALHGWYFYTTGGSTAEIQSADTNLFLVNMTPAQRSFYASDGTGGMGNSTASSYGIDIIVSE